MQEIHSGLPQIQWDENQLKIAGHMLQGRPWAMFQQALGRQVFWAESSSWSWLGIVVKTRGIKYLYVPYGPTVSSELSLDEALDSLKMAAKELKLDFIRCEPNGVQTDLVHRTGFIKVRSVQPQESLIIDLTQDLEILRTNLSSSHRNTINGAERRGLVLRSSINPSDIEIFLSLMHATADSRSFHAYPDSYYRTLVETLMPNGNAMFFLAEYQGKIASATLCMDYQRTRAYAYTGNDPGLRQLRATAPLVWKIILDSKQAGFERFDLWGIAPLNADKNHPWAGFSEFKRSFGGRDVFYSGTWELPINRLKYRAYRLAKKAMK
ncbi:MAG TPA: peptidoglycan bridge formation glycyltransferase FemA/FemB family protein [Candidatus Saccharimonadia bacterium]|nr:peptidoglycan bridge formation glycyltransferase FemA/FemB family protein [Candidatus Saccharimonadia bacterium]